MYKSYRLNVKDIVKHFKFKTLDDNEKRLISSR